MCWATMKNGNSLNLSDALLGNHAGGNMFIIQTNIVAFWRKNILLCLRQIFSYFGQIYISFGTNIFSILVKYILLYEKEKDNNGTRDSSKLSDASPLRTCRFGES